MAGGASRGLEQREKAHISFSITQASPHPTPTTYHLPPPCLLHTHARPQVPDASGVVERLLLFLDSGCEEVVAEALVQMKNLLRRYPDMAEVGNGLGFGAEVLGFEGLTLQTLTLNP